MTVSGVTPVLVEAARTGDAAARDQLLVEVRRGALRYAIARGVPHADAEDLAQEVCMAVLQVLPRWKDSGKPVWAFVFRVLHNKIADRARAGARAAELHDEQASGLGVPDGSAGPEELLLAVDGNERMNRLLAELPKTQREVMLLRVVVGLDTAETARALGLARGSVHVLQHRAVRALRMKLMTTGPTGPMLTGETA
jgi:RNA polymerase sigma-70 factor (ECF subfamily)